MKVKDLRALLATLDDETTVVVAGFETTATKWVAEVDTVIQCETVTASDGGAMSGDKTLASGGAPSVWLGWSGDYRSDTFLRAVAFETWAAKVNQEFIQRGLTADQASEQLEHDEGWFENMQQSGVHPAACVDTWLRQRQGES